MHDGNQVMNQLACAECETCGAAFNGEDQISKYLERVDRQVLFRGSKIWECTLVCAQCIAEGKASNWSQANVRYAVCRKCRSSFNIREGCNKCAKKQARF